MVARCDEGRGKPRRIERWRVRGAGAGQAGGAGGAGLAAEQPDLAQGALGEALAGVAVGAVQQQAGPELGLGIGALVGESGRVQHRAARQDGPALDEDELRGDRHERAHIAEAVRFQARERIEVGVGEAAQRDGEHVELACLDQRQEERQRTVELGELDLGGRLGPAPLAEADRRRGRRRRLGSRGSCRRVHHGHAGAGTVGHQLASSASCSSRPASGSIGASWCRISSTVRGEHPAAAASTADVSAWSRSRARDAR